MTKNINTKDIKTLTQEQQVLNRINMYLGSMETLTDEHPILDETFQYSKNKYSVASQQLFYEIIQNSIDNYIKSNRPKNYYIDIKLSPREFTVKNNGRVFELKNNQKCFDDIDRVVSVLNTSSNYTESAQTAGTNGLGAKLVCLTQALFEITVQNNNLKYTSAWKNMKEEHQQTCIMNDSDNYFQVHVKLLPLKFVKQITKDIKKEFNFVDLDIPAINFYLMNLAQILPIKIKVNNKLIKAISTEELFQPESQFIFQNEDLLITLLYKSQLKKDYAFINGILCNQSPAFNDLRDQIKTFLGMKTIKVDCQIIIQGFRKDVKYNEQIKNKMTTKFPGLLAKIKPKQKVELLNFVTLMIESKVVRNKNINVKKYMPASKANSKLSDCSLILTEGLSAAGLFNQIPTKYKNKNNPKESFYQYHGLFALKGKVMNVTKKDEDVFDVSNDEIKNIIKIIGFQQGVKYNHQNLKNLRYHSVIIASDYDDDGFHIKGLLLNFLLKQWPELLELGFFKQFTTPIIVADDIEYYQDSDFDRTEHHRNVKYYKGLGSIDKQSKLFINICTNFDKYIKDIVSLDEPWKENMNGLFGKDSQDRKDFIIHYRPRSIDHTQDFIKINDILTQQVVEYSFKTLERAIPCIMDGLKDSQRKIVYHASRGKFYEKVANFAADVSKTYDYHHGETSLSGAIELLAQDCVGSNNCPLLKGVGQFGSNWNPKDIAADRYIYVTNSEWLQKLIRPEDKLLYKYNLSDDGRTIEPQQIYPIMPIFLLNGVTGVASGWSSTIPCFAFEDVRQYLINYLQSKDLQKSLHPSYNNYLGKTEFQKIDGKQVFVNEGYYEETELYYDIYETHLSTCKSKLFEALQDNYQIFPERLSVKVKGIDEQVDVIRIKKSSMKNLSFDELSKKYLVKVQKMENMTLIEYVGKQIIPKQFNDIHTLIQYWAEIRLLKYCQRKQLLLKELLKQFIIRFNYNEVKTKNMLDKINDESLTYERISYLTPESQVPIISKQFDDIEELKKFLIKSFKKVQSTDQKEYDYIMDKSVKYFTRGEFNLKELEDKYISLHETSARDIWINELKEIKV